MTMADYGYIKDYKSTIIGWHMSGKELETPAGETGDTVKKAGAGREPYLCWPC